MSTENTPKTIPYPRSEERNIKRIETQLEESLKASLDPNFERTLPKIRLTSIFSSESAAVIEYFMKKEKLVTMKDIGDFALVSRQRVEHLMNQQRTDINFSEIQERVRNFLNPPEIPTGIIDMKGEIWEPLVEVDGRKVAGEFLVSNMGRVCKVVHGVQRSISFTYKKDILCEPDKQGRVRASLPFYPRKDEMPLYLADAAHKATTKAFSVVKKRIATADRLIEADKKDGVKGAQAFSKAARQDLDKLKEELQKLMGESESISEEAMRAYSAFKEMSESHQADDAEAEESASRLFKKAEDGAKKAEEIAYKAKGISDEADDTLNTEIERIKAEKQNKSKGNKKGRKTKGKADKQGDKQREEIVPVLRQNYYVNKLVALHFVPNDDPQSKTVVSFKDDDKSNNEASNLFWETKAESLARRRK